MFLRAVWVKWLPPMENSVAVAAEHEHMQVGPGQRHAAGKRQRAAVDEVGAVSLDEIREPARAADAGDGGDLLVPEAALLDQLEIERQHGEIAAARAPGRVVGGDFLLRQRLAVGVGEAAGEPPWLAVRGVQLRGNS